MSHHTRTDTEKTRMHTRTAGRWLQGQGAAETGHCCEHAEMCWAIQGNCRTQVGHLLRMLPEATNMCQPGCTAMVSRLPCVLNAAAGHVLDHQQLLLLIPAKTA
jgi:hypothetical protein